MRILEIAAGVWIVLCLAVALGLIGHAVLTDPQARAIFGVYVLVLSPMPCIFFLAWRFRAWERARGNDTGTGEGEG